MFFVFVEPGSAAASVH